MLQEVATAGPKRNCKKQQCQQLIYRCLCSDGKVPQHRQLSFQEGQLISGVVIVEGSWNEFKSSPKEPTGVLAVVPLQLEHMMLLCKLNVAQPVIAKCACPYCLNEAKAKSAQL